MDRTAQAPGICKPLENGTCSILHRNGKTVSLYAIILPVTAIFVKQRDDFLRPKGQDTSCQMEEKQA